MYMHVCCLYNFIVHVDLWHVFAENTHSSMTQLKTIFQHLRVLHHAHTLFVEPLLEAQYLRNSCSLLYSIKAAVEALARRIYKPTKSASSIKAMKLAKRKVTSFQAIKLTCALESEVQTLKATVSQHEKDSNRELFPVPC